MAVAVIVYLRHTHVAHKQPGQQGGILGKLDKLTVQQKSEAAGMIIAGGWEDIFRTGNRRLTKEIKTTLHRHLKPPQLPRLIPGNKVLPSCSTDLY